MHTDAKKCRFALLFGACDLQRYLLFSICTHHLVWVDNRLLVNTISYPVLLSDWTDAMCHKRSAMIGTALSTHTNRYEVNEVPQHSFRRYDINLKHLII